MKLIEINYSLNSQYKILIEKGIVRRCGDLLRQYTDEHTLFIITVPPVRKRYYSQVVRHLKESGITAIPIAIPDGERSKQFATINRILRLLFQHKAHRTSLLIGLGGGVVGDITGYCASIFMRGIRYVHIPTTLIAQSDSSIGGKTGINTSFGKNLIGSFHQPSMVIIDPELLATLPEEEFINGLGEVIKYGILNKDIFYYLEAQKDRILQRDPEILTTLIELCCSYKATIVNKDPFESGERAYLNLGHTVGHALETITDYKFFKHGEAIAWGIVAACSIAYQRNLLKLDSLQRIMVLMDYFKLLKPLPDFSMDALLSAMRSDKKRTTDLHTFILPSDLGVVRIVHDVNLTVFPFSI